MLQSPTFSGLPREIQLKILMEIPGQDLLQFCANPLNLRAKSLCQSLQNNNEFWTARIYQDFPELVIRYKFGDTQNVFTMRDYAKLFNDWHGLREYLSKYIYQRYGLNRRFNSRENSILGMFLFPLGNVGPFVREYYINIDFIISSKDSQVKIVNILEPDPEIANVKIMKVLDLPTHLRRAYQVNNPGIPFPQRGKIKRDYEFSKTFGRDYWQMLQTLVDLKYSPEEAEHRVTLLKPLIIG